jgi:hypothetical protein
LRGSGGRCEEPRPILQQPAEIAKDLLSEFPGVEGLSARSLRYEAGFVPLSQSGS